MEVINEIFLDSNKLLENLQKSGLQISSREFAITSLRNLNYYRISGYFKPFLKITGVQKEFREKVFLEDILSLIEFDQELRSISLKLLAQFEITLRARVSYHCGKVDTYMHERLSSLYIPKFNLQQHSDYTNWITDYKKREENGLRTEFKRLKNQFPIWVAVEFMDFGLLSKFLRLLPQGLVFEIADSYRISPTALKSWVAVLNDTRNVAAHHNRLWNRNFVSFPRTRANTLPIGLEHLQNLENKFYLRSEFLKWYFTFSEPNQIYIDILNGHLANFPKHYLLGLDQMGFPVKSR